jgi:hypothetical protein
MESCAFWIFLSARMGGFLSIMEAAVAAVTTVLLLLLPWPLSLVLPAATKTTSTAASAHGKID